MATDTPNPMTFGLRMTLDELGLPMPNPAAEYALGRLAALELGSSLGLRSARRALARERQSLLRRCLPGARGSRPSAET